MKKIADMAGVSPATVSRVLNHPELVRESTRKRVLKIIEELGYKPNRSARSLRVKRAENIGLIIPEDDGGIFSSPYLGILLKSISKELEKNGFHFIVSTSPRRDLSIYEEMSSKGIVDGFILVDVMDEDERIELLKKANVPFVIVGKPLRSEGLAFVDVDNFQGMYEAASFLLKSEHERIFFVNGPKGLSVSRQRLEGLRKAFEDSERDFDPSVVLNGSFDEMSGYKLTKEILKRTIPDAVIYSGDVMAFGGMLALREHGFRIGKDVSVIGFDDVPLSEIVGLSSVHQPIEKVGSEVARMILRKIEGKRVRSKVFKAKLVLRESVRRGG